MRKRVVSVQMMAAVVLAFVGSAATISTMRAEDWPTRPVRVLIPFTAGGTADMLGRLAAEKLSVALGQQFVPVDKPGACGLIVAAVSANAAPYGNTLLVSVVVGVIL